MIADTISNADIYHSLSPRIAIALDYLQKTDFSKLAPGRYEIDGENVFALVQHRETRVEDETQWEAHKRYTDIQYITEGVEKMGYAPRSTLKVITPLDEAKDIEWLKGKGDFITVSAGGFAIFYPEDAHMPSVAIGAPATVKKVVVKVLVV